MSAPCIPPFYSPAPESLFDTALGCKSGTELFPKRLGGNPTYGATTTLPPLAEVGYKTVSVLARVRELHSAEKFILAADTIVDHVIELLDTDDFVNLDDLLLSVTSEVYRRIPELANSDGQARIVSILTLTRPFASRLPNYEALSRAFDVKAALRVV